jgi:hypothetical protein
MEYQNGHTFYHTLAFKNAPLDHTDFISMGIDSLFVSESNLLIFSSIVQFCFQSFTTLFTDEVRLKK